MERYERGVPGSTQKSSLSYLDSAGDEEDEERGTGKSEDEEK